ncbi:MAG: hypothetical protein U0401_32705 [Anaerolineae bacterium]
MNLVNELNARKTYTETFSRNLITAAIVRMRVDLLGYNAMYLAEEVSNWQRKLVGIQPVEDFLCGESSYPALMIPWWLAHTLYGRVDIDFHTNLVYAFVNGYYAMKLTSTPENPHLSVALHFFHTKFNEMYHPYFPADHTFWRFLTTTWIQFAESLLHGHSNDVDARVALTKIAVAAVCFRHQHQTLIAPWFKLVDSFGVWEQALEELIYWQQYDQRQIKTWFLDAAAQLCQPDETTADWVKRQGLEWGFQRMEQKLDKISEEATALKSQALLQYLIQRKNMLPPQKDAITSG